MDGVKSMNTCDKCNDTGMVSASFEGIDLMIPCWHCLSEKQDPFTNEEFDQFLKDIRSEYNA